MKDCPISKELREVIIRDIREAMIQESVAHYGASIAYAIDLDLYAEQVFVRLWGIVRNAYLDYLADLGRGIPRQSLVDAYREGIARILEAGGVTIETIERVVSEHTNKS